MNAKELVDLRRITNLLDEIKNHEDCGGGWVCFEKVEDAVLKLRDELYLEIGKRLCTDFNEKRFRDTHA